MTPAFWARFDALPVGPWVGRAFGRRWEGAKSKYAGGRASKLVARAPGGTGYISANVYDLTSGRRLYSCEMPVGNVVAFVMAFERS